MTRQKAGRPKKANAQLVFEPVPEETTSTAKPTKATKAASVRSKRGVTDVEESGEETAQDQPKPTRSTRAGSVRGKKAAALTEEVPVVEIANIPKSTANGSVRGRKPKSVVDAPALPAPEEHKPARQTRGAATKPQPLSPKKITQVSKPQTRNAINANSKAAAKAAPNKPAATGRNTRKRTVSDENAEVADFNLSTETGDDDIIVLSSTPKKTTSTQNQRNQKQEVVNESDVSMSSRPTTPSDSAAQSFNTTEEEVEAHEDDELNAEAAAELSVNDDSGASEDELCGPKTPMRRASPSTQARYQSSVQRTIRKYDDEMRIQTPARRFAVLGSQQGTPQTQKPYCKPAAPSSETRPMTVARGTSRPLVFRDLRDGLPNFRQNQDMISEQDEMSFLPDEDIIPADVTPCPEEPVYLESRSESATETGDSSMTTHASLHEEDERDFVAPAAVQKYSDDPDETVIIHEVDGFEAPASDSADSFQTEDTVLIERLGQHGLDDTVMSDGTESEAGSVIIHQSQAASVSERVTPAETKQPAVISVDFDAHFADTRDMEDENTPLLTMETTNEAPMQDDRDVACAEVEIEQDEPAMQAESRRQTVNFNEFFDVAALSEPTAVLNLGEELVPPSADAANSASSPSGKIERFAVEAIELSDAIQIITGQRQSTFQEDLPTTIVDFDDMEIESAAEQDATNDGSEDPIQTNQVPHYALPTIASDIRRKSLPAMSQGTPVKSSTRPNTSDGASVGRIANPFANAWWNRSRAGSTTATPVKARPATSHATPAAANFGTPSKSQRFAEVSSTPIATPKERYPLLSSRKNHEGHANTVAGPARFGTPSEKSPKRRETFHKAASGRTIAGQTESFELVPARSPVATPKERYPVFNARNNYDEHAQTVAGAVRFQTPPAKSPKRRQTFHKAAPGQVNLHAVDAEISSTVPSAVTTPQVATPRDFTLEDVTPQAATTERYPRLRPRPNYAEHAKTVAGPVRFQTPPAKTPLKRPATGGKSDSLRKATLIANTPVPSHTPMKTPLKAPGMTPSQAPMTPHPAAPLRGVVALVEVFTLEGASASAPFAALLHRLGAKTTRSWNDRITHVVFKDGSPMTLQRVRLNNKETEQSGKGPFIHCVNSRWVTDCDTEGARVDESGEEYLVDVSEVPRGGKRRRKSMEPSALLNLGGNIVRDRKSSFGRNRSLSRSPFKVDSPAKKPDETLRATPEIDMIDKENSGDEQHSPATPAWISAPDQLVQQTAPMKRVRKLELPGKEAKNRRLTFWNGTAA